MNPNETQTLNDVKTFLFQSQSTASLLQFDEKSISRSDVNKIADDGMNEIGKHRIEKCQNKRI